MPAVPACAQDLTPEWLSAALGAPVVAAEVLDQAMATNHRLRLRVSYAQQEQQQPGGRPDSFFVKLPSPDPAHRRMIGGNSMGKREVQFYSDVAPSSALRVPAPYVSATAEDGDFVLLLEDLATAGCRFSDGDWGVTADAAAVALEELARFHARFEDPMVRASTAGWMTPPKPRAGEMIAGLLRSVLQEHRDELTPAYVATGELYADNHARVDEIWNAGPQTFVHGDPHIGNVFLDQGRVGFHDWGLSRVSTHLRDVSYFLTMAVDPDDRRRSEQELIRLYLDALQAAGGADIGFDDAWFSHRVQAAYTVLATFLVFMPGYAAPEAQVLGAALMKRAQLALDDLDAADALRSALRGHQSNRRRSP